MVVLVERVAGLGLYSYHEPTSVGLLLIALAVIWPEAAEDLMAAGVRESPLTIDIAINEGSGNLATAYSASYGDLAYPVYLICRLVTWLVHDFMAPYHPIYPRHSAYIETKR